MVYAIRNVTHGIEPLDAVAFNSMAELPYAVEKLVIRHGIKLHRGSRSRKWSV